MEINSSFIVIREIPSFFSPFSLSGFLFLLLLLTTSQPFNELQKNIFFVLTFDHLFSTETFSTNSVARHLARPHVGAFFAIVGCNQTTIVQNLTFFPPPWKVLLNF